MTTESASPGYNFDFQSSARVCLSLFNFFFKIFNLRFKSLQFLNTLLQFLPLPESSTVLKEKQKPSNTLTIAPYCLHTPRNFAFRSKQKRKTKTKTTEKTVFWKGFRNLDSLLWIALGFYVIFPPLWIPALSEKIVFFSKQNKIAKVFLFFVFLKGSKAKQRKVVLA